MIKPPAPGQPVEELWRTVAELTEVVNALTRMEVNVHTIDPTKGSLAINAGKAVLTLY